MFKSFVVSGVTSHTISLDAVQYHMSLPYSPIAAALLVGASPHFCSYSLLPSANQPHMYIAN
jgi:hypothetical protein